MGTRNPLEVLIADVTILAILQNLPSKHCVAEYTDRFVNLVQIIPLLLGFHHLPAKNVHLYTPWVLSQTAIRRWKYLVGLRRFSIIGLNNNCVEDAIQSETIHVCRVFASS